ncbi:MAG: MFS transporter [Oscillospiraceae bacterium]|nr:MFS transporter [Oscillospiraceae bacterium]
METKPAVLTKKKKLGYAFGIATESLLYNMYYTYFLTFLVQIIHIKPNIAGIVIFISIAWDAVTDPILGNISDKPGANKRKLMLKSVLPLGICFIIAWSTLGNTLFGESQALKMVFYTVISMLIWLFYTMYTIPYYAVVAELTEDYDERTKIRGTASFINAFCIGLGNIMPALVGVGAITYIHVAGGLSILAVLAGLICAASLKGVYQVRTAKENEQIQKGLAIKPTLRSFGEILKLKPVKYFLLFVFFFLAGNSMLQSNLSYMVVDCIGVDYNSGIAIVIGVLVVTMAATVPIVTKVSEKTDRRTACLIFISISAIGLAMAKIVGLDASIGGFKIMLVAAPLLLGIGLSTFWTVFYSMSYDIVELDEFVNGNNGERRESIITAFPQLVQKFGSATGILLQGIILGAYGYDTTSESGADAATFVRPAESIVKGMENVSSIIPAVIIGLSLVFLILYPVTRKTYNTLTNQLKKKRAGEKYSSEGIEKLL